MPVINYWSNLFKKYMIERIECRISAEKSNYDYLRWIKRSADKFEVTGIVFNNDDGSIGVIAEGEDTVLTKFSKKIMDGHPIFNMITIVDNFSMKWHKATGEYKDFQVISDKS